MVALGESQPIIEITLHHTTKPQQTTTTTTTSTSNLLNHLGLYSVMRIILH